MRWGIIGPMRKSLKRLIADILKVTGLYGTAIAARARYRNRSYRRWIRLYDTNDTNTTAAAAASSSSPEPSGPVFSIIVPTHQYNRRDPDRADRLGPRPRLPPLGVGGGECLHRTGRCRGGSTSEPAGQPH